MTMNPKAWIAAAVVIVATGTVSRADTKNEVRAVTFAEDGGITRVHVRGAETPTFTVYKLERPSRVVIDLPQARLAESLRGHEAATMLSPNTWAVSAIAAQQLDDGLVRVIVTLARPGRYDVKTDGNEVIVMVMPRDAAPKTASPAELEAAKQQAQAAEQARIKAEQSSIAANATAKESQAEAEAAKAEADRLRKTAAEQAARAEAAQRAVEEAKQAAQKNAANKVDIERAKKAADAANAEAARAKAQADDARKAAQLAQVEAERMRVTAEQARRDAQAEATAAKADAQKAHDEMEKARAQADEMAKSRAEAEAQAASSRAEAQQQVAKSRAEAQQQVAQSRAEAEAAKRDADKTRAEATAAKHEAEMAKLDAAKTRAEMATQLAAAQKSEAQAREALAAAQKTEAQARETVAAAQAREQTAQQAAADAKHEKQLAEQAAKRAQTARDNADDAHRAQLVAEAKAAEDRLAKARHATDDAEARRKTAEQLATVARQDLEHSKTALADVEQQRRDAEQAAHTAQAAARTADEQRAVAEKAAREALAAAQKTEAQARETVAAAQAREQAAQQAAVDAKREKQLAEQAAKRAQAARDQSLAAGAADDAHKAQLVADAKAAEERLAKARKATDDAEARRLTAEQLATVARQDLEHSKTALAGVEQQRRDAEAAAHTAQAAARTADEQRAVAEKAARDAMAAKRDAEAGVAELTKKQKAAQRAADDVAARTKAEAKAQADMDAAKAHKASDDEIAAARREVARLADERKRAESELADRKQAVAAQQAEAQKLEAQAASARDAAAREESRRTQLVAQRENEEREIAKLEAQRVRAQVQAQAAQTPTRSVPAPKPATPTPSAAPLAKVQNVTFKGNDVSGVVELAMSGDANVELGEVTATHVELIVEGADMAQKLERTLDVSKFGSPVKKVSAFRDRRAQNRIRLVAELGSPAIPTVVRDGNTVRWRLASNDPAKRTAKLTNIPPTVLGGFGAASTPVAQQSVSQVPAAGAGKRRTYYGATVDFDFKDAPIHDLLRIIADTGGVNIVVPDSIDAKVTVRLKRVPWDQALEVILASHGLGYRREGNLFRIAPKKELDAEDEAEAARRAAMVAAEQPKPEVVTMNYASADELKSKLEGMLTPGKGKIEVDGRTNSLIINDVASVREAVARLAYSLDIQTPQITIEARIVEARSTFVRQFGIQWGGRALAGAAGGNATGLIFPSSVGLTGGNDDNQTRAGGISALPSDFAINMPASTGTGEGGAIGMSLGSVGGNFNINLRLSALEDTGTVRIVSAPKITVLNNKSALIRQGVSIPISVVSAAGTQTQFVQADLKLEVTPYVSQRDCVIAMTLDVTKNEPDFVNVGARGDPTILRKEAHTTMLVSDGETTVLGGIYTRNTGLAYKKVPFFGDLPVIGWFFKSRRENDDRTEILVFITPKITNKASLRCVQ